MAKGTFSLSNIQVGGRVGDLLFLPQPDGRVVVRRMPTELPERTPAQDEATARMTVVGAAWRRLSSEDAAAWDRYVEVARGWPLPPGGKAPTQGYGAFLGLSAKILQMRPGEALPTRPPETAFLGDGILVDCRFSIDDSRLIFEASSPNVPGVVTELLLQKLKGAHRKPTLKGYRTRGFFAFAAGSPAVAVPCEVGAWACAVRFVREATGQETGIVPIGRVVAG